jgi:hypothetical protein
MGASQMQIEANRDSIVATGTTEEVMEALFGPQQHAEHMKGWRWHVYMRDADKRAKAVDDEVRKMIAERRATAPQKVSARLMQKGDVVGSGETVISVSAGVRTPRGKVEVILERDGERRTAVWGAYTLINVRRAA